MIKNDIDVVRESGIVAGEGRLEAKMESRDGFGAGRLEVEMESGIDTGVDRLEVELESRDGVDAGRLGVEIESVNGAGEGRLEVELESRDSVGAGRLGVEIESVNGAGEGRLEVELGSGTGTGVNRLEVVVESGTSGGRAGFEAGNGLDTEVDHSLTSEANRGATVAASRCLILAVETSCDETSVAIVENGKTILANMVSSQIETHKRYGGVVPEIASRQHVESITLMLDEAVRTAGIRLSELSAVAVTQGPGLVGSLLVGVVAAKALALAIGVPLIGVHHIAGHIYANGLVHSLEYPLMALVVSGGHTELVNVEAPGQFRIIGQTRDDAAGEAYDKVARAMGLPYPGGPHVDRLAQQAEPGEGTPLPRAWLESDSYDFSFSGLKSAVLAALNSAKMRGDVIHPVRLSRGFQDSVVEVLVEKALRAASQYGSRQLLLAGGVAANRGLRDALTARCERERLPLLVPPLSLCTDNAAMIAAAAYLKWERGEFTPLDMKAEPLLSLEAWSVGPN